jgi:hypothetical protein
MNHEEIERWLNEAGHHALAEALSQLLRKSAALSADLRQIKEEARKIRVHFVPGPETLQ